MHVACAPVVAVLAVIGNGLNNRTRQTFRGCPETRAVHLPKGDRNKDAPCAEPFLVGLLHWGHRTQPVGSCENRRAQALFAAVYFFGYRADRTKRSNEIVAGAVADGVAGLDEVMREIVSDGWDPDSCPRRIFWGPPAPAPAPAPLAPPPAPVRVVGGRPLWCAFRTQVGRHGTSETCPNS